MTKHSQNRSTTALLWIGGLAALVAVVLLLRVLTRDTLAVRTAQASYQTLSSTVSANGKITVVGEVQAHAPVSGVVKKLYVEVGQRVGVGARLVDLESADARKGLAAAQLNVAMAEGALRDVQAGGTNEERGRFAADINTAKADLTSAQANLAVVKRLNGQGAASTGEVTTAQQRVDSAALTLKTATARSSDRYSSADRRIAEARLADARAGVASAQSALAGVTITSPIAGTVYAIGATDFDYVPQGEVLLDVADLSRIEVLAYFDEPEIGKLAKGQSVTIKWDAKPSSVWHGHVVRAPTTIAVYGTRNVGECLISVDDAHGDLLPNTNVTVKVTESQRSNVLSIPREALHTEGLHSFVYRVLDGKLARTDVTAGVVNLTSVEIAGGLSPKDVVVLGPAVPGKELSHGMSVKPVR